MDAPALQQERDPESSQCEFVARLVGCGAGRQPDDSEALPGDPPVQIIA